MLRDKIRQILAKTNLAEDVLVDSIIDEAKKEFDCSQKEYTVDFRTFSEVVGLAKTHAAQHSLNREIWDSKRGISVDCPQEWRIVISVFTATITILNKMGCLKTIPKIDFRN